MRIRLTPELEAYCAEHKIVVTDGMELDDSRMADARQMWSRQHPDKDAEEIEIHAIGLVASQVTTKAVEKRDWKDAAWKIAVMILLLFIAIRGHAQIDVIKVQDNAGAAVGTIAAPFTFKAGANCTWAKAASTYTFNCAGGAAGAGGVNTQVQWNSTGSLAGISSFTTDGTINTALTGADWLFADLTTPTKKFQFDASNISAVTTRTMNVPDANATFAQAIAAVSHKFITQMSAQGLFTLAQPDYSDLTGTPTLPANTTATGSNFFTAYNSTTGAFTKAQPAFSDISGTATSAQLPAATTSTLGAVIVRDNLAVDGSGNLDFQPNDASTFLMMEEFASGATATGSTGGLGWSCPQGVGTGASFQAGVYPNLGILRCTTSGSASQTNIFSASGATIATVGDLKTNTNWETNFIFRLNNSTNDRVRIGLINASSTITPTDGAYFRFDQNAGVADTTFHLCGRTASGTETCSSSTLTADTAFHRLRIRSTTAGTWLISLLSSSGVVQIAEQSIVSGGDINITPTTVNLLPGAAVGNDITASAISVDFDFFSFKYRGLAR